MVARYSASFSSAALVTLALLFLMQQMIAMGRGALTESTRFRIDTFVNVERRPVEPERQPEKPRRFDELEQPDVPQAPNDGGDVGIGVSVEGPDAPVWHSPGLEGMRMIDGDLIPIAKVLPSYPPSALRDGLEGYVIVEFTVTRTGTVADVAAVESSDRVFERAAVDAASKFRYRPRVINGEAVEVHGVRNKVTFELDE